MDARAGVYLSEYLHGSGRLRYGNAGAESTDASCGHAGNNRDYCKRGWCSRGVETIGPLVSDRACRHRAAVYVVGG